jgi:hypothetical protein
VQCNVARRASWQRAEVELESQVFGMIRPASYSQNTSVVSVDYVHLAAIKTPRVQGIG